MLEDLQRLFRESVAAFRAQLEAREPEDQVAELLSAMRRELVAARAAIPELAADIDRVGIALANERKKLDDCERRGALAERAGDNETMRVAAEFAEKHRVRVRVLDQKLAAARAEHEMRKSEAEEMMKKFQTADSNRFVLVAELRRAASRQRAQETASASDDIFSSWARMEESIGDNAGYADALDELSDTPPADAPADDVEAKLRELKRKMGR